MALHGIPELIPGTTRTRANVKGEYSSNRSYRCYFDPTDSDIAVHRALPAGLARWTSDPSYAGFVVIEVEVNDEGLCTFLDGATLVRSWIVNPVYDVWTNLFNSPDGNPINQPPIASIEATEQTAPAIFDVTDPQNPQPITNTVGDPYDPPLEMQQVVNTLVIRQNLRNPNIFGMMSGWVGRVNSGPWQGFPARTLLIGPIALPSPEYYQDGGFAFYPMEFRMLIKPDTHDKKVLNQGFRQYDTSQPATADDANGNPTYPLKNVLIEGQPAQEPVLLDANGKYLAPPVDKDDVVVNTHQVYPQLDFSTLPFNNVVIPTGS